MKSSTVLYLVHAAAYAVSFYVLQLTCKQVLENSYSFISHAKIGEHFRQPSVKILHIAVQ